MAELIINGKDAYATWGVRMGKGFRDAIGKPVPIKPFVENKSRLEDGKRVVVANPKKDEIDITLPFTIQGNSPADYQTKKDMFYEELYKGSVSIQMPAVDSKVYHLIYQGKSVNYGQSLDGKFGKVSCRFNEPNPANRK